jgi:hypothetical protein
MPFCVEPRYSVVTYRISQVGCADLLCRRITSARPPLGTGHQTRCVTPIASGCVMILPASRPPARSRPTGLPARQRERADGRS